MSVQEVCKRLAAIGAIFSMACAASPLLSADGLKQQKANSLFENGDGGNPSDQIRRIVSDVSDEALLQSVKSDSVEICLASAWEVVRRKGVTRPLDGSISVKVRRNQLSWFAGVADARLPCDVPQWWKKALQTTRYLEANKGQPPRSFFFPYDENLFGSVFFPFGEEENETYMRNQHLVDINKTMTLSDDDRHFFISEEVLTRTIGEWQGRTFEFFVSNHQDDRIAVMAVVPYPGIPRRFELTVLSQRDKKIKWQQTVWAGVWGKLGDKQSTVRGVEKPIVEIMVTGADVWVFGAHPGALYVESFDLESGLPQLRFSTSY